MCSPLSLLCVFGALALAWAAMGMSPASFLILVVALLLLAFKLLAEASRRRSIATSLHLASGELEGRKETRRSLSWKCSVKGLGSWGMPRVGALSMSGSSLPRMWRYFFATGTGRIKGIVGSILP